MQGEVESFFGEGDGSGLGVDEYFVVVGKTTVGGDSIHLLVGHRVPRRHSCVFGGKGSGGGGGVGGDGGGGRERKNQYKSARSYGKP